MLIKRGSPTKVGGFLMESLGNSMESLGNSRVFGGVRGEIYGSLHSHT
jgi:hypothetical protein